MAGYFDGNFDQFRRHLYREAVDRLEFVGGLSVAHSRFLAGRPGTEDLRSKRGEPPRRQSGRLVDSIDYQIIPDPNPEVRFGSPLDYALYLERDLNRPYLTKTLEDLREAYQRAMGVET